MTQNPGADQGALFLAEGGDALDLDGLGPALTTTPLDELDLPRLLAPGVIAYPTDDKGAK
jgi:hypothetical protein